MKIKATKAWAGNANAHLGPKKTQNDVSRPSEIDGQALFSREQNYGAVGRTPKP
jgi:hypothetical protein